MGTRIASSPDSDLEAFSHNPTYGSFAPLAFQPSVMTNCGNQRFLSTKICTDDRSAHAHAPGFAVTAAPSYSSVPGPSPDGRHVAKARGNDVQHPGRRALGLMASGATCVQRLDGSRDSAIHTKYRISLRSSSMQEPRYPLPRVFRISVSQRRPHEHRLRADGGELNDFNFLGAFRAGVLLLGQEDTAEGSPTETLLRLLLPLNDKVQWTSHNVAGMPAANCPRRRNPVTTPDHSIGRGDGRQIAPPTKNGHAPPPIESRKSSQSVNPYYVWTCRVLKATSADPWSTSFMVETRTLFVFHKSKNFTSDYEIRMPPTVPVNHYSDPEGQHNRIRILWSVSQAPSPESNPNSPSPVTTMVGNTRTRIERRGRNDTRRTWEGNAWNIIRKHFPKLRPCNIECVWHGPNSPTTRIRDYVSIVDFRCTNSTNRTHELLTLVGVRTRTQKDGGFATLQASARPTDARNYPTRHCVTKPAPRQEGLTHQEIRVGPRGTVEAIDASPVSPTCPDNTKPKHQPAPGRVRPRFGMGDDSIELPTTPWKNAPACLGQLAGALGGSPIACHPDPPRNASSINPKNFPKLRPCNIVAFTSNDFPPRCGTCGGAMTGNIA
ncbi:hypothetical protein TanjilG_27269 [Lupinus angustifolius]|uniref:Uncharacterized protein n=1 Tax=Lupinus angustifolius TaxID=3871 RepID=A0A1J7FPK2_LUPAN|nr:hypothetical protein TanjilG_27269 [Lupinus angustifolius]